MNPTPCLAAAARCFARTLLAGSLALAGTAGQAAENRGLDLRHPEVLQAALSLLMLDELQQRCLASGEPPAQVQAAAARFQAWERAQQAAPARAGGPNDAHCR